MSREFSFERLEAYKLARELAGNIYRITSKFPRQEQFGLANQITRAAVSIPSNLAEGTGKHTKKEKAHYTSISFSSLMEVLCQLQISMDLNYLSETDYKTIRLQIDKLAAYLSNLRKSQLSQNS